MVYTTYRLPDPQASEESTRFLDVLTLASTQKTEVFPERAHLQIVPRFASKDPRTYPYLSQDFALILRGDPADVSLADWKAHTSYHDYAETDAQIEWFWRVVESFSEERRRRLLFFATAFNYLPATGFKGLPDRFHIFRGTDLEMLPISHTCFLQLVLPPYDSYEMMKQRLMVVSDVHVAESYGMS